MYSNLADKLRARPFMTAGEEEILVDIQQGKTPANINQKGGGTRLVQI